MRVVRRVVLALFVVYLPAIVVVVAIIAVVSRIIAFGFVLVVVFATPVNDLRAFARDSRGATRSVELLCGFLRQVADDLRLRSVLLDVIQERLDAPVAFAFRRTCVALLGRFCSTSGMSTRASARLL